MIRGYTIMTVGRGGGGGVSIILWGQFTSVHLHMTWDHFSLRVKSNDRGCYSMGVTVLREGSFYFAWGQNSIVVINF